MRRKARYLFAIGMFIAFPYILELMFSLPSTIHNQFVPNSNLFSALQTHSTFETALFFTLRIFLFYQIIARSPDEEIFEDLSSALVPINNNISDENILNFRCALDTVHKYRPIKGTEELILTKRNNNGHRLSDIIASSLNIRLPDLSNKKDLKIILIKY